MYPYCANNSQENDYFVRANGTFQLGHIKGTGTRDYNWLKVVCYDGSWLGESSADIQNFFNCPFNFILD